MAFRSADPPVDDYLDALSELSDRVRKWQDSGEDTLSLSSGEVRLVQIALAEVFRAQVVRDSLDTLREREGRAVEVIRGQSGSPRFKEAAEVMEWPFTRKGEDQYPTELIVFAYHNLTTEEGQVGIRTEYQRFGAERDVRFVDNCPLEPWAAITVLKEFYGFPTRKACAAFLRTKNKERRKLAANGDAYARAIPDLEGLPNADTADVLDAGTDPKS